MDEDDDLPPSQPDPNGPESHDPGTSDDGRIIGFPPKGRKSGAEGPPRSFARQPLRRTSSSVALPDSRLVDQKRAKVGDERVRLLANYLNTVASGLMVTGVVGPIANYLYGTINTSSRSSVQLALEIVVLISSSVCVHLLAGKVLERLDR